MYSFGNTPFQLFSTFLVEIKKLTDDYCTSTLRDLNVNNITRLKHNVNNNKKCLMKFRIVMRYEIKN